MQDIIAETNQQEKQISKKASQQLQLTIVERKGVENGRKGTKL